MKIFSLPLLLVLFGTTAFAQSQSYSIDNFDFRNGVRVEAPAPSTRIAVQDPRRPKVRSPAKRTAAPSPEPVSLVKPTILFADQPVNIISANASSLRGYTTGSAQVDSYLVDSGTRNGVDPLLLYSVMHQESSFKSHALSPKGARG